MSADPRTDPTVRLAWAGAGIHAVSAVAAVLTPAARGPHVVVALALFVGGSALGAAGFVRAVTRSAAELVDLGGAVWLAGGAAPKPIARALRWCLVVQTLAAVGAAAAEPYTSLAFSILTPIWGLGAITWWAGRHGTFRPRPPQRRRR